MRIKSHLLTCGVITCLALVVGCGESEQQQSPDPLSQEPSTAPTHSDSVGLSEQSPASSGLPCTGEMAPKKNPIKPIGTDEYLQFQACMAYAALIESYVGLHEQGMLDEGSIDYEQGSLDYYIFSRMISEVRGGQTAENIERGLFCDCLAQPIDAFWDADIPHPGVGSTSRE